ncbi:hypothetical protein CH341_31870, partial [Rhodoplanes roseus]
MTTDPSAEACVEPKQFHDVVGYYNRFDIFDMRIDRTPREPATFADAPSLGAFPPLPADADTPAWPPAGSGERGRRAGTRSCPRCPSSRTPG